MYILSGMIFFNTMKYHLFTWTYKEIAKFPVKNTEKRAKQFQLYKQYKQQQVTDEPTQRISPKNIISYHIKKKKKNRNEQPRISSTA